MSPTDRRTFLTQAAGAVAAVTVLPERVFAIPGGRGHGVAVIGAGRQGRAILAELQRVDGVTIVAICDSDASRLSSGLRRAQGAEGVEDHRGVLDRADVESVFVATPTHLHRQIVEDALAAGKNVYCEGPLASTIEDARAIVRAARNAGPVFQAGLQARSNPVYKLARSFYRSDSVRDLVMMRAQSNRKTTWRTPASSPERAAALNWRLDRERSIGLAGEWGTHQFDVFHWYTGKYPTRVRGWGAIRAYPDGRDVADTIGCELTFADGATLQYQATLANSYDGKYEVLYGTNAAIKLGWSHGWMFKEADAPTQGWEVYANRQQFHNDEGITLIADATKLASQGKLQEGIGLPSTPLHYAVSDFLKSVTEGEEVACTPEEGYRSTVVGILANRAVVSGETVEIGADLLRASDG